MGRINAAGQASLSVAPDKAVTAWSLHINATDANSPLVTQADARNATATILQNIFSQLGADGIPQQALQTDSITFSPINQRVKVLRTDLEPQLTCWCQDGWAMKSDCFTWQDQTSGWSATVAFSVTLTGASVDPKTLSDVISKARPAKASLSVSRPCRLFTAAVTNLPGLSQVLAAGKDNVTLTDLRFDLSSDLRQKSELAVATKAVADARSKADAFAQAAGGRLQLPLKVQETPITDDSIGTPITLTPVPTAQPAQTSAGVATLATRCAAHACLPGTLCCPR